MSLIPSPKVYALALFKDKMPVLCLKRGTQGSPLFAPLPVDPRDAWKEDERMIKGAIAMVEIVHDGFLMPEKALELFEGVFTEKEKKR